MRTVRPGLARVPSTHGAWGAGSRPLVTSPCASGTYSAREAGARSLCVARTYVSAWALTVDMCSVSATPRSLGDVLSIFFFLAFMMLGSVAYLVARVRVRVKAEG